MSDREIVRLELTPAPIFGAGEEEDHLRRLRRALKCLLRTFGWRCTRGELVRPDGYAVELDAELPVARGDQ